MKKFPNSKSLRIALTKNNKLNLNLAPDINIKLSELESIEAPIRNLKLKLEELKNLINSTEQSIQQHDWAINDLSKIAFSNVLPEELNERLNFLDSIFDEYLKKLTIKEIQKLSHRLQSLYNGIKSLKQDFETQKSDADEKMTRLGEEICASFHTKSLKKKYSSNVSASIYFKKKVAFLVVIQMLLKRSWKWNNCEGSSLILMKPVGKKVNTSSDELDSYLKSFAELGRSSARTLSGIRLI